MTRSVKEISRCTGHCCVAFILTKPLPQIKADVASGKNDDYDHVFAAENFFEIMEMNPTFMHRKELRLVDEPKRMLHSCRQYDHDTKSCKAYDKRPEICSEHPWNNREQSCSNDGCTLKYEQSLGTLKRMSA